MRIGKRKYLPYLFMLPALLLILSVFVGPLLGSLFLSMTDWDGISKKIRFVGLSNFAQILKQEYIGTVFNSSFDGIPQLGTI